MGGFAKRTMDGQHGAMGAPAPGALSDPFGAALGGIPAPSTPFAAAPPMGPPVQPSFGGPPHGGSPTGQHRGTRPAFYTVQDTASLSQSIQNQPSMPPMQQDAQLAAIMENIEQFNSPANFVRGTVTRLPNSVS